MAKTFKVGDKVRAIDNTYGITNQEYGFEGVVVAKDAGFYKVKQTKPKDWRVGRVWNALSAKHFELVDATPTKKQRIKALENEVKALKARIEALENGAIPNNETGCNYIANKMAEELKRHLEAEQQTPMSANQRRKAVIDRAKAFVADVEKGALCSTGINATLGDGNFTYQHYTTKTQYHVNKENRVVTVLAKGADSGRLLGKAIARCAPGDVFNEHIGKAIALAKAYGLACPKEFTDAPQPEIAVGQVVKDYKDYVDVVIEILDELPYETLKSGEKLSGKAFLRKDTFGWIAESQLTEILDDTEAQYE